MKAFLLAAALLALATLLPAPAAAQQMAAVTVQLQSPEEMLQDGSTLAFSGLVTFTADPTAYLGLMGIPVTYTVSAAPEWASVVISPASDVFPLPSAPTPGTSYSVTKVITVVVSAAQTLEDDTSAPIEITATTTPAFLGRGATGKGSALVAYDAIEEPCPEHALSEEQLALYAERAAEALNEYEASRAQPEEDVTVQSTGAATPVSLPWIAAGGFAVAGAGVGLVLRRRFSA